MFFYKGTGTLLLIIMVIEWAASAYGRPILKRGDKKQKNNHVFLGTGTYFNPKNANGACGGSKESSSSDIVALNSAQYGPMNKKSEWCGKKVLIKHAEKQVIATIQDACPGCQEKSLDMTPSVFNKLADSKQGIISITWCLVSDENCN